MAEDLSDKNTLTEPKECIVCYTDGVNEGSVQTKCSHFLCLPCYTNIIIQKGGISQCPYCRKNFLKPDEIIVKSGTSSSTGYGAYTGVASSLYTSSFTGTPSTYLVSSNTGVGAGIPLHTSSYTGANSVFSSAATDTSTYISSYTNSNNGFSGTANGTSYLNISSPISYISSYTMQNNENNH
jgi:hypothetical protein